MMSRRIARQMRRFNAQGFGSTEMRACMGNLPATPDRPAYQKRTLEIIESFDEQGWYQDPVRTVCNGKVVEGGSEVATVDAFFKENGRMVLSDEAGLAQLKEHCAKLGEAGRSGKATKDYRDVVRAIEQELLGLEDGSRLIAYQAIDFKKQDGFFEIEEWTQAAGIERRLNDALLADEAAGKLTVHRDPAFIGCVSNFSNFLDLGKKCLRNLEVGVPVVVLSRNNTTQHMYRWFQRLSELAQKHGLPAHMLTYAALDVAGQRALLASCPNSPMHFTGSREVAAALKEVAPNLMAATVGPNTFVATEMTEKVREAVRISSTIENAGQCTHVRHVVVPGATLEDCEKIYDDARIVSSPAESIRDDFRCDGFVEGAPTTAGTDKAYTAHPRVPAAYRVNKELPSDTIDEKWRQGFIDVTSVESKDKLKSKEFLHELADWLVRNGPITLAVNGDNEVAKTLFERTSMTVYTIGDLEQPGLTVSARPQEMEAFGEFPARPTLSKYTKFPVLVPSSAPSFHSEFTEAYLEKLAGEGELPAEFKEARAVYAAAGPTTQGYLRAIQLFLQDACGPRDNTEHRHARTAVAGWQRPPLNDAYSVVRVGASTSVDAFATYVVPYLLTNAKPCLYVSVHPDNAAVRKLVEGGALGGVPTKVEDDAAFEATAWERPPYNIQYPLYDGKQSVGGAPMLGSFLSLLFPLGHIKCLQPNNQEFIKFWKTSPKWLAVQA